LFAKAAVNPIKLIENGMGVNINTPVRSKTREQPGTRMVIGASALQRRIQVEEAYHETWPAFQPAGQKSPLLRMSYIPH
jgi:hypothetical protein